MEMLQGEVGSFVLLKVKTSGPGNARMLSLLPLCSASVQPACVCVRGGGRGGRLLRGRGACALRSACVCTEDRLRVQRGRSR